MQGHGGSRALRIAARAAFGGALAAFLAVPAGAAWDGNQAIRLGDAVSAEFEDAPGEEVHRYSFFVPDGAVLTTLVKGDPGLATHTDLLDAMGADVDTAAAEKPTGITKFAVPARGAYSLQVTATAGTGVYSMKTKATYPKLYKATLTNTLTYQFGAPKGTLVSATVKKAKTGAANPQITKIAGPLGDVAGVTASTRVLRVPMPSDGTYTLTVVNNGTAGDPIDLTVQLTLPKSGRPWNFGCVETARGTPTVQRTEWMGSGHADKTAMAFTDWNDAVPAVVPTTCAKCHSGGGFQDFLVDGVVNTAPAAGARTVDCEACHDRRATKLTSVTFPSGLAVNGLGGEAICMTCHQGRESTKSVEAAITAAIGGVAGSNDDTVFPSGSGAGKLGFKNVHYFAAGASLYGAQAKGAYEYADPLNELGLPVDPVTGLTARKFYDRKFDHVTGYDQCMGCHDQHSLEVKVTECATCHVKAGGAAAVATLTDLRDIRMDGTVADFDGDGNVAEGTWYEIEGISQKLYDAIRAYSRAGATPHPIVYNSSAYPYWFNDLDDDGVYDAGETNYSYWTPRLLRAAYNYQFSRKDPGAFAHNAKYVISVVYDSIADIHSVVPVTDFDKLVRNDHNHFDAASMAYRDWDGSAGVSSSCSRCHSVEGFRFVVNNPNERNQQVAAQHTSGMNCESCHVDGANFTKLGGNAPERVYVSKVIFPFQDFSTSATAAAPSTGAQVTAVTLTNAPKTGSTIKPDDSFICMTCHQGRQSKLTLDAYVAANPTKPQGLSFQNVHYLPAGAVQYSTKAAVGYAWTGIADSLAAAFPAGRTYQGPWTHSAEAAWTPYTGTPPTDSGGMTEQAQCTFCHMQDGGHSFAVEAGSTCTVCHSGTDVTAWRKGSGLATDFDGDAATTKLADEVKAFEKVVLKALNTYAARKGKRPLAYNPDVNSYFFYDDNQDGIADSTASTGRYAQLDKYMLFGAHDMHFAHKEKGSWAHNARYVLQLMYDSADYLDDELWNGSPVNATTGAPLVRPTTIY